MSSRKSNNNIHAQVREIMLQTRTERWNRSVEQEGLLRSHVAECGECAQQMDSIQISLEEVRAVSASIAASVGLVRSTQLRVRARARELKMQEDFMRPLGIAAVVAFLWAGASMPFLWQGFEWLGRSNDLPAMVWVTGFVVMSLVPAAAVGTIALARDHHKIATS